MRNAFIFVYAGRVRVKVRVLNNSPSTTLF